MQLQLQGTEIKQVLQIKITPSGKNTLSIRF
jgi:hypothetical protein